MKKAVVPETVSEVAGTLCNARINRIKPVVGGRNSNIFRVQTRFGDYALKFFRSDGDSNRQRFKAETTALNLFGNDNLCCTPRLVSQNSENNCILMEWVDGEQVVKFGLKEVDALASFVQAVHEIAGNRSELKVRYATEACLSGDEVVSQINRRLQRLEPAGDTHLELQEFLNNKFIPIYNEITTWSQEEYRRNRMDFHKEISPEQLTLSPVDIGFHNCLRKDDKLYFLDFEFFGWDDPVKLVADTLQHPGSMLNEAQNKHLYSLLVATFKKDHSFMNRLRSLSPLYGLKWCMIMLNPFLVEYKSSLSHDADIKKKQLMKVKALTMNIALNYGNVVYE
jgi:thiamine kinase-like enzyme